MRTLAIAVALLAWSAAPGVCGSYQDLNAGIAARNSGDWNIAIKYFDSALAANDLVDDLQYIARLDRGQAHAAKGELDAAIADYSVCVGKRPGDPTALFLRASTYLVTGKPDAARQDAETVLADNPDDAEAHLIRSRAFAIMGDAGNQLKDLQSILVNYPKSAVPLFETGIAYVFLGQADEAGAAFDKAFDIYGFRRDHYSYGWLWLAIANLKQGKPASQSVSLGFDDGKWPGVIVNFYRGRATEDAVNSAALTGDARAQKGQACEAAFYVGEWQMLHGDSAGAKLLLGKAVRDCPRDFDEWYAAQEVLKNAP